MGVRLADMAPLQTRRAQEEVRWRRWVDEFAMERRRHSVEIAEPAHPRQCLSLPTMPVPEVRAAVAQAIRLDNSLSAAFFFLPQWDRVPAHGGYLPQAHRSTVKSSKSSIPGVSHMHRKHQQSQSLFVLSLLLPALFSARPHGRGEQCGIRMLNGVPGVRFRLPAICTRLENQQYGPYPVQPLPPSLRGSMCGRVRTSAPRSAAWRRGRSSQGGS